MQILTFGSLLRQINSFQEVLETNLEQIFQKKKISYCENSTLSDRSIL